MPTLLEQARKWVGRLRIGLLVWGLFAGMMAVLIVGPIFRLVELSFRPEGQIAGWTLQNYFTAFGDPTYLEPIFYTALVSFITAIFSCLLGSGMAWVVSRTDIPGKTMLRITALASFVTPPFLGAVAWSLLAGPNAGLLNQLYRWVFGFSEGYLFNIFSIPGVIFTLILYTYPLVFIVVYPSLRAVSGDMEDAANILGSGTVSTMARITLPLVAPAIIAGFILSFLEAMIIFAIPAMLAIPARTHVMTTQLRAFLLEDLPAIELAAAYSVPLLLVAGTLIWMRTKILGRRSYVTVGGKGGRLREQKLGWWKWILFVFCLLPVTLSLFLPYFILGSVSLMKSWGRGFIIDNFTLSNFYNAIFLERETILTMKNTLFLAVVTATVGTAIASVIAYVSHRRLVWGHRVLAFLATAPLAVPGIVLAVGLFVTYTRPPFSLYGTIWIIFLAYLTKFLPVAFQTTHASVQNIDPELEECSRILGANQLVVFKDVTVPLFKMGIVSAWALIFMPSLRELSSSVLLYTNHSKVLSVLIFEYYEEGHFESLATLGVLLLAVTFAVLFWVNRITGRDSLYG